MRAQFIAVEETRTRVLSAGEGPSLLLLHPIGHSADVFIRNIEALATRFHVIAPDLPGHGFSDRLDFKGKPPQQATAQHLCSLMTELDCAQFAVLGSSYGGLIAALMALDTPERVRRLCIVGSASTFGQDEDQATVLHAVKENVSRAMRAATLAACRERLGNILYDRSRVAEEILPLQLTCYAFPDRLAAFLDTMDALITSAQDHQGRIHDRLEHIRQPALVIVGRNDTRADWRTHERGAQRMANARCLVFDECGHLPQMEHPARFNSALLDFIPDEDA